MSRLNKRAMNTITKKDLISTVAKITGEKHLTVIPIINTLFNVLTEEMNKPDTRIELRNFGTFHNVLHGSKSAFNMHTKERIQIAPRYKVRFQASRTKENS